MQWYKENYVISDDRKAVDTAAVKKLMNSTPWGTHRNIATIGKIIDNSLCFSLFEKDRQIGFGRAITDYTTYALFFDIIIAPTARGKGLGGWLFATMTVHPDIGDLKQVLWTSQADGLYRKFGFQTARKKPMVMFNNYFEKG